MRVTIDHIEELTPFTKTFWFRPEHPLHYVAGQFIEINLPHDNPDDRGIRRWFTLSSSPTEELLSITTRFARGRRSTFMQTLDNLKPGAAVAMSEPMGDFVLPMVKSIPLLFVAGGIGITPMRSMIKWLLDSDQKRHIQMFYSAETPDDFVFTDLLARAEIPTTYITSNPDASWNGKTGQISAADIMQATEGSPHTLIYISGPEVMTETLVKDLSARGIPGSRLVTDYFPGYQWM